MSEAPPRRILLATAGLYTGGGIASVSRCIVRALVEARAAGRVETLDIVSLMDEPDGPRPAREGRHVYARGSHLRFVWQLWRLLREGAHDLVLFDHAGLARAIALPMPGFRRPRRAIFAHGGELDVITGGRRLASFVSADQILTNSQFTADQVRTRFPAVADRTIAVPLCIAPERVELWEREPDPVPERREPAVLIVGRMWAEERGKGHDALFQAIGRVRERVPEAELWVVGTGDDVPRLEEIARGPEIAGAVRFFGGISDRELGGLYRRAGVFAMPSRQEGFGLVYAEAMWHGLACIGSTADAAREVISDGETGFLVPYDAPDRLAEAIVRILADPVCAQNMASRAAAEARSRFTYPRFAVDLLAALGL